MPQRQPDPDLIAAVKKIAPDRDGLARTLHISRLRATLLLKGTLKIDKRSRKYIMEYDQWIETSRSSS